MKKTTTTDGYKVRAKCISSTKVTYDYEIVDPLGNIIVPSGVYDYIGKQDPVSGLLVARLSSKNYKNRRNKTTGYIDIRGKVKIPFDYTWGSEFHNGYAAVAVKQNYSIINSSGDIVLDNLDDACFVMGTLRIRQGSKIGKFVDEEVIWDSSIGKSTKK